MSRTFSFSIALVCLLATPAAAQLGPKHASDIVHLRSPQPGGCAPLTNMFIFPERALPDGKSVPFAVPKGKVLIVRHVSYELFSNMVGAPLDVSVVAGVGGSLYAYAVRTVLTDPSGVTSLEFEFPVGFAVPEGGSVCVGSSLASQPQARLEGYFAPAK
jgi:hypothetical protein